MKRACGILLPIFSLPGNYGIGCFSVKAYEFVDTLKKAGQTYWQILPLGPTGYGDSPYQAFSSFAGNPYFIDLDELAAEGLLDEQELRDTNWGTNPRYVDYGKIWESREKMLRKAFAEFKKILDGSTTQKKKKSSKPVLPDAPAAQNLLNQKGYDEARKKLNPETREFCLYRAVKNSQGGKSWTEWEDALRLRKPKTLDAFRKEHAEEIEFYEWVQIVFEFQWRRLRQYANVHGIRIIGDMPIYVSPDSSDAWSHPELFQFDENAKPVKVAGCPPDYFSPDGQLWGNPLYNWKYHKKTDYEWWMNRMEYALTMYDIVRVDHFRGFDEYFAIPADAKTAKDGKWEKGPGMDLFRKMQKHFEDRFPELPIIAEDLGLMTDSVIKLVTDVLDPEPERGDPSAYDPLPGQRAHAGGRSLLGLHPHGAVQRCGYGHHSHVGLPRRRPGGESQHAVHGRRQLAVEDAAGRVRRPSGMALRHAGGYVQPRADCGTAGKSLNKKTTG